MADMAEWRCKDPLQLRPPFSVHWHHHKIWWACEIRAIGPYNSYHSRCRRKVPLECGAASAMPEELCLSLRSLSPHEQAEEFAAQPSLQPYQLEPKQLYTVLGS